MNTLDDIPLLLEYRPDFCYNIHLFNLHLKCSALGHMHLWHGITPLSLLKKQLYFQVVSLCHLLRTSDHGQATDKFMSSTESQVHPFCNIQSRVGTHVVLVMCLYVLLGIPTT